MYNNQRINHGTLCVPFALRIVNKFAIERSKVALSFVFVMNSLSWILSGVYARIVSSVHEYCSLQIESCTVFRDFYTVFVKYLKNE